MRVSTSLIASAALTAVVSATTCKQQPVGNPSGNPIGLPGLAQQVQAGTPFTITWEVCSWPLIEIKSFGLSLTSTPLSSLQHLAVSQ